MRLRILWFTLGALVAAVLAMVTAEDEHGELVFVNPFRR